MHSTHWVTAAEQGWGSPMKSLKLWLVRDNCVNHAYWGIIHSGQDLKPVHIPTYRWKDKGNASSRPKQNKMTSPVVKWIELEVIMLSEISRSRKIKITFFICRINLSLSFPSPYPPPQVFTHVKLEEKLFVGERGIKEGNGEQIWTKLSIKVWKYHDETH